MKACVYTIPAGLSFVESLAQGILQKAGDDPLTLARMQILLPTRRACRSLREAFLKLSKGKPLLLPRMNAIGDVDEEDLSLTLAGMEEELALPPALPPLRRQFMLVKLIGRLGMDRGIEQDMMLASALGRLMDQIYTEDLDLADLPSIVDRADFATHWQVSLDFLAILSIHWPLILAEQGMIDAADRRNHDACMSQGSTELACRKFVRLRFDIHGFDGSEAPEQIFVTRPRPTHFDPVIDGAF